MITGCRRNAWLHDGMALLLFAVLSIGFLSPMSSDRWWSQHDEHDLYTYLQSIDQACRGLDEGQFPVRVAPDRYNGWRYAFFQWYAPLTYTLAGAVQKFLCPGNPLQALRIVMWLALTLAGFSAYKLAAYLARSRRAGLLAGAVFMTAPVMLTDMHVRFQMQECLGASLSPLAAYYMLRTYASRRGYFVCMAAAVWGVMTMLYGLALVTGSLVIGALMALLLLRRRVRWAAVFRAGVAYGGGILLAGWSLMPYLMVGRFFELELPKHCLTPINFDMNFSLPTVLSPLTLPVLSPGAVGNTSFRFGWPSLLAAGIVLYALLSKRAQKMAPPRLAWVFLLVFALTAFIAWSPIQAMWSMAPSFILKVQFAFRFMFHAAWLGAVLAAWAARYLAGGRLTQTATILATVGIAYVGAGALPMDRQATVDGKTSIQPVSKTLGVTYNAEFNHGRKPGPSSDYEVYGHFVMNRFLYAADAIYSGVESPLLQDYFGWLVTEPIHNLDTYVLPQVAKRLKPYGEARRWFLGHEVTLPAPPPGTPLAIRMRGLVPGAENSANSVTLVMHINGVPVAATNILGGREAEVFFPITGLRAGDKTFGLKFTANAAITLDRPNEVADNMGRTRMIFSVRSFRFEGMPPENTVLPATAVQGTSRVYDGKVHLDVHVPAGAQVVQLPAIYYPGMLDVRVDGKPAEYFPTFQRFFLWMASVRLPPGLHRITVEFVGYRWANWLSLAGWTAVAAFLSWNGLFRRPSRRR